MSTVSLHSCDAVQQYITLYQLDTNINMQLVIVTDHISLQVKLKSNASHAGYRQFD